MEPYHRRQAKEIQLRAEEARIRAHNVRYNAGCSVCGAGRLARPLCPDCYICSKCVTNHSECAADSQHPRIPPT